MNKKFITLFLATLLILSIPMAIAKKPEDIQKPAEEKGPKIPTSADNGLVKGGNKTKHLYLFSKNETDWSILLNLGWGKLTFKNNSFVFNAHGLVPGGNYSLIYYPDYQGNPWPRVGILILANGTANDGGNIHLMGEFDFTTIPIENDINILKNFGAKIWLVLSEDLQGTDTLSGWNPASYLFEYALIRPRAWWYE